jgi:hypothetical protein
MLSSSYRYVRMANPTVNARSRHVCVEWLGMEKLKLAAVGTLNGRAIDLAVALLLNVRACNA